MAPTVPSRALVTFTISETTHAHCALSTFCQVSTISTFDLRVAVCHGGRWMELLLVLCVLVWACGCGVWCGVRRRGREVGRKMRAIGCAAALLGSVTVVTWRVLFKREDMSQGR